MEISYNAHIEILIQDNRQFFVSKLYECAQVKQIDIQYTVYPGNYLIEGVANTIKTSGIAENN